MGSGFSRFSALQRFGTSRFFSFVACFVAPSHCRPPRLHSTLAHRIGSTCLLEGASLDVGRCPLWVKDRHTQRTSSCPLYPRKRPRKRNSAKGHVRFTPKSGHVRCNGPCLLWANSGHWNRSITARSFSSPF